MVGIKGILAFVLTPPRIGVFVLLFTSWDLDSDVKRYASPKLNHWESEEIWSSLITPGNLKNFGLHL